VDWDESGLTLHGTRFRSGVGPGIKAGPDELRLMKPRWMIERYVELIEALRPKHILELGIHFGGSVAFLAMLAKPEKHVAVDLRPGSSAQFENWLASHVEVVRPYYGVDQADVAALRKIVATEFPDSPVDLVIDDASHRLEPTQESFNVLFPLLRPGGVYVIEDWSADHRLDRFMEEDPVAAERVRRAVADRPELLNQVPLTRLVFEIVLASAYTDLIDSIEIRRGWLSVIKGLEQPDPEDFDIAKCHLGLGRRVLGDESVPGG
jgi:predicted O-methyltransferase YrrM